MNKTFLILLLEIYAMVFGGIALFINSVNILIMELYNMIIPSIIVSIIVIYYLWMRYSELANHKDYKITNKRFIFAIISLFIVAIIFWSSFDAPLDYAKNNINKVCNDAGLIDDCSGEDLCEKDCLDLNKEYYKYEFSSGFFSATIKDCWCIQNDRTEQIW